MVRVSDFFFAMPSFLSGFARILDFGGQFDSYNVSRDGDEADVRALFADWMAVGEDITRAGEALTAEIKAKDPSAPHG
jgi:hypothetical protein